MFAKMFVKSPKTEFIQIPSTTTQNTPKSKSPKNEESVENYPNLFDDLNLEKLC